ncbi:hypothetical protein AMS68_001188 [Peltaster fructicola]|uniref:Endoplasmic reticulum oxidoreductin 1 n=1 Tax=Peltaster fructicola TaxID=286661 RepID=A0A6H0XM05_9PEZI|nr:hypothetical protein AMS68_001188 [Peltaster fructicola]
MKATRSFYLAFFALFSECSARGSPTYSSPDVCAFEPNAKVSDACASYTDLDTLNNRLNPYIRNLANNTDFFSYYRLNLYNKKCPFWDDESGTCGNSACAVRKVENEEDIPEIWRAEELGRLVGPKAHHPGKQQQKERKPLSGELGDVGESCIVEYDDECDDRDYCVPEDETAAGKGDYVSLADNPERFTGYGGESAHQIWEAIYRENCFSRPGEEIGSTSPFSNNQLLAVNDFKQVMQAHGEPDECLEKRVFYRIVSGMHASISTHLCDQYLNQTTGEWAPNLQCYKERLHHHPERISNLYFNYALVLRAVGKLKDYVRGYTFCTGDSQQDRQTREMMSELAAAIPPGPKIFDESVMFQDTTSGVELKDDFKNRFRNISRVMDCVGCDKCRLWGKLQTNGLGTALKVLFEFGGDHASEDHTLLRRTELVALINTLDKISSALKALERFRVLATELVETPTLDELEDLEERYDEPTQATGEEEEGVASAFWEELDLVWRAYVWVLKSWFNAPRLLFDITAKETIRLFQYWMGKPVPERSWQFRAPSHEEL